MRNPRGGLSLRIMPCIPHSTGTVVSGFCGGIREGGKKRSLYPGYLSSDDDVTESTPFFGFTLFRSLSTGRDREQTVIIKKTPIFFYHRMAPKRIRDGQLLYRNEALLIIVFFFPLYFFS